MATCALIIGCPASPSGTVDPPPPIIERFEMPELPREYPLYESDEIGRLSVAVASLNIELGEAEAEIKRLSDVIETLEIELTEAQAPVKAKESVNISTYEAKKPSVFEVTAYTARCEGCSGITKTGYDVRDTIYYEGKRVIAVDPSVIPLHSAVRITTSGGDSFEAVALDIGSAIKGNRIDILYATKDEARKFGRQTLEVEILQ